MLLFVSFHSLSLSLSLSLCDIFSLSFSACLVSLCKFVRPSIATVRHYFAGFSFSFFLSFSFVFLRAFFLLSLESDLLGLSFSFSFVVFLFHIVSQFFLYDPLELYLKI